MANTTLSNDEILEAIGNKSVIELVELIDTFKTKFNVTISAVAAGAPAAAAAVVEEQTEFAVILKEIGAKKIQVTKDVLDGAPQTVKAGVSKDEAAQIKAKLEAEGATVEVK